VIHLWQILQTKVSNFK